MAAPHEHGTFFGGGGYDRNIGSTGFTNSTATTAADGTFHDLPLGVCANGAFSSFTDTQFITLIMPDGSAPVYAARHLLRRGNPLVPRHSTTAFPISPLRGET
jgi:hypothetical protein